MRCLGVVPGDVLPQSFLNHSTVTSALQNKTALAENLVTGPVRSTQPKIIWHHADWKTIRCAMSMLSWKRWPVPSWPLGVKQDRAHDTPVTRQRAAQAQARRGVKQQPSKTASSDTKLARVEASPPQYANTCVDKPCYMRNTFADDAISA